MDKILKQFLEIAEQKSINAAAKILGISQPALSRNMQRLEENFGKPLITRAPSGILLTEYGKILYRRARIMELEYQYTLEEFKALEGIHDSIIRIGSGYDWSLGKLPQILKMFSKKFHDVGYHIDNGYLTELLQDLNAGKLDIVLAETLTQNELPNAVTFEPIRNVQWKLFTSNKHPLQQETLVTMKMLNQYHWIAYNVNPIRSDDIRRIFDRIRIKRPPMRCTSNSMITLFKLMQDDHTLVTCLPAELSESAKYYDIIPLQTVETKEGALPQYNAGIYYRTSALRVPYIRTFVDLLRETYLEEIKTYE